MPLPSSAVSRPKRTHLIIAILGFAIIQIATIGGVWKEVTQGAQDFSGFYSAGRMIVEGRSADLYDLDAQWEFQRRVVTYPDRQVVLPFNHPPHEALLYVPLALLPYVPAYLFWIACNLAMLAFTIYILRGYIPALTSWLPRVIFAAALFSPVAVTVLHGQDSILLLLLFSGAFVCFMRGRDAFAGVLLAIASLKFQLALPFLIALLAARRWRTLAGYVGGGAALAGISALAVGWRTVLAYPSFVLGYSKMAPELAMAWPERMPNLRGFLNFLMSRWTSPGVVSAAVIVVSVAALIWLVSTMWRNGAPDGSTARNPLAFAFAAVLACLLSFHHYAHDQVVLALPMLLLAQHISSDAVPYQRRKLGWLTILAVIVTAYLPIPLASLNFAAVAALALVLYREVVTNRASDQRYACEFA